MLQTREPAEYDLASLGEVESVTRPYGDPPKWTLEYKERGPAESGALIKPKA
jgi:hypothetical protein